MIKSKDIESKSLSRFFNNSRNIVNISKTRSQNQKIDKFLNQDKRALFDEKITNGDPNLIKIYTFS